MTWYDYPVANHRFFNYRIQYAKTSDHYTEKEILELYDLCRNQFERDWLTDRLYLIKQNRDKEYAYYSARQMLEQQEPERKAKTVPLTAALKFGAVT